MSDLLATRIATMRDLLSHELVEPDPTERAALRRLTSGGADDDGAREVVATYLQIPAVYLTTSVTQDEVDEQMSLLRLRCRISGYGMDSWRICRKSPRRQPDTDTAEGRQALREDDRRTLQVLLLAAEHLAALTTAG